MTRNRMIAIGLAVGLPIVLLVLGFVSVGVLKAMKPPPEAREKRPAGVAVFAETVSRQDVQLTVSAQGEAAPRRQVTLAPQISGRVTWISDNLVNGGFVKKGETLLRLEDADYRLAAVRAESGVASARQALARVEAEAEVARRELQDLGMSDVSPLALKEPQLAEARAAVAAAQAQAQDAALQLSRTRVSAPFDGLVLEESVDVGQFVGAGVPVAKVFATDVIEVELPIPNSDLGALGLPIAFNATKDSPGPQVTLTANVGGVKQSWTGEITRTGAAVDARTRLVSVFAEVEDPFGQGADNGAPLAPGLFVDAQIIGRSVSGVVLAPRSSLRGADQIYVIESIPAEQYQRELAEYDSKRVRIRTGEDASDDSDAADTPPAPQETGPIDVLRIRTVEILRTDPQKVYVVAGLDDGDRVITSPVQAAYDGMRVRIIADQSQASGVAARSLSQGGSP